MLPPAEDSQPEPTHSHRATNHADDSEALLRRLYAELHQLAGRMMGNERAHHTLQPTALVHEAWLRLGTADASTASRPQFKAIAARAMRQVLVDHARAKKAKKRGGQQERVALDDVLAIVEGDTLELLALDEAMLRLQQEDPELATIVELRFFAGLTLDETAEVLSTTRRRVDYAWTLARAWLHRELNQGEN